MAGPENKRGLRAVKTGERVDGWEVEGERVRGWGELRAEKRGNKMRDSRDRVENEGGLVGKGSHGGVTRMMDRV